MDINRIRNQIETHYKQKKEEYIQRRNKRRNDKWEKYYSSNQWKTLRNIYYSNHPICEVCEKEGIITPAEHVHHYKKFSSGLNEEARWNLLLNYNNLISLCKTHHEIAHKYMNENNTDKAGIEEILKYDHERDIYK